MRMLGMKPDKKVELRNDQKLGILVVKKTSTHKTNSNAKKHHRI